MKYSRDLRRYASRTNFWLIIGGFGALFVIGLPLIYWIYGPNAALLGLLCLLAGLVPIILVLAVLWLLDRIAKNE